MHSTAKYHTPGFGPTEWPVSKETAVKKPPCRLSEKAADTHHTPGCCEVRGTAFRQVPASSHRVVDCEKERVMKCDAGRKAARVHTHTITRNCTHTHTTMHPHSYQPAHSAQNTG